MLIFKSYKIVKSYICTPELFSFLINKIIKCLKIVIKLSKFQNRWSETSFGTFGMGYTSSIMMITSSIESKMAHSLGGLIDSKIKDGWFLQFPLLRQLHNFSKFVWSIRLNQIKVTHHRIPWPVQYWRT